MTGQPAPARPGGPGLSATWLGHSTVVLDVGGTRVVTDPLLHRHAGILRRRGRRPAEVWRGSDAVLLSHLHHDHAQLRSLRLLPGVPVLTAPENAAWLRTKDVRGVGLDDGEWYDVAPGARARLVRAVHGHRPMPRRPNAANGHLLQVSSATGTRTVWAAGDTEAFAGLAELPALAGAPIDLALVPVHGWGPRLSRGHLGPLDAARVCATAGVRVAVPVHWGTLHVPGGRHLPRGWMDYAGEAFRRAARREAPGTRVVVLHQGESWTG
ncbi:MBL fold metallo-hydrolase [Oerskovia flava]|uniref:MBL fold metallo-hydrolase n=1 Tax=Oerskovia flava TaxID=2986422 RepID=UPI00223F8CDA|nr:MBL fold metallo-hydrolase [Oerskovia sp. JB1-3-2]